MDLPRFSHAYMFSLMQGDDVMLEFDQYVMYHEMKKKTEVSKWSSWAQQFFSEVPAFGEVFVKKINIDLLVYFRKY